MPHQAPLFLIIDSAADICSVAIADKDGVFDEIALYEKNIHSEKLTLMIQELFSKNALTYEWLAAVGVNKGPGSYTGLRIGVSVAKGICFALNIPLISCDGLLAYATHLMEENKEKYDYILTALDARRDEVYASVIDKNLQVLMESKPLVLDEQYNFFLNAHCKGNIGIFSNCVDKFIRLTKVNNVYFNGNERFKSLYLHKILCYRFENKYYENLNYFEPNYIKIGYKHANT
jgi:tRNA threonylcarbamoyladenosine biosynthesis protein TsaB